MSEFTPFDRQFMEIVSQMQQYFHLNGSYFNSFQPDADISLTFDCSYGKRCRVTFTFLSKP